MDFRVFVNILRFLAILSVICAHVSTDSSSYANLVVRSCGTVGVGLFFFLSGYFFYYNKKDFIFFWKTKFKTIIVPWLFCGTIDWLYVVLRKGGGKSL